MPYLELILIDTSSVNIVTTTVFYTSNMYRFILLIRLIITQSTLSYIALTSLYGFAIQMSLFQTFTDDDINSLLMQSCYGKFELKDKHLVMQLAFLTLSLTEHNLLKVHDVINEKGEVYKKWDLPSAYSRNNQERIIEMPEVLCLSIETYLDWYVNQELPSEYRHNLNTYRGLSQNAPLLLNDRLKGYAMNERTVKNGVNYQATNLSNKVKGLLNNAGLSWATPKTFSDSLIVNLGRNNVDVGQITKAFGFQSRQVVLDKINGNLLSLSDAINHCYSRIKTTGH